ncbi:UV DNA damage repair endonuclease UvsE [Bacillus horti]|uniref:UV DNA damage endonuclease n=1 Tax=Caldalkalibacillus horti TaxID=77523 RepID=A0ABT9VZL3_9BACI|nr:UV DNA damage repair endonuclease UvsE [Bacillus horti]MDQ0166422.1 UV DNA damage endonuclease [Bacillus horti]
MTTVRLGYVAMSVNLQNSSPSQTMTFKQFSQLEDREAAVRKLERIAQSNVKNCLRLLRHNVAHDILFFRLSSRLVPLATHQELDGWDYMKSLTKELNELGEFINKHQLRVDFHPDHFVLLNSPRPEVFKDSLVNLRMHFALLKGMKQNTVHRCVMHVGGNYKNTDEALERFVSNWANVPKAIQQMIMLENDDKSFDLIHTLYLCEKLGIPLVFDYHHHLAHNQDTHWENEWGRVLKTWEHSPLPVKMHISSPRNEKQFRAHADFVDGRMFMDFLRKVKGSVPHIDCMIEAKQKDSALFRLMEDLKEHEDIEIIDGASFKLK